MADAVASTLARNRGGIPAGYMVDPVTGQLIRQGAAQIQPTFAPTTNFGAAPTQGEHTDADGTFWDANGTPWKLVGDQWIQGQRDPITNQWRFANNSINEVLAREGATSDSIPAGMTPEDYWRTGQGAQIAAAANPNYYTGGAAGGQSSLGTYQDLLNNTAQTDAFRTGNDAWQQQLEAARQAASQGRQDQITRQQGYDQDAINRINDLVGQQAAATAAANAAQGQLTSDYQNQLNGFSGQIGSALGNFNTSMGALNTPFSAQGYGAPVVADPYGSGLQSQSYNTLSGIGGGSLDYQAQLASLAQAAAVRAQLSQWQTNPEEYARQLDALQAIENDVNGDMTEGGGYAEQREALYQIQRDLKFGGEQQQRTLDDILNDVQYGSGYSGQDEAARLLRQELQYGDANMNALVGNLYGELGNLGARHQDIVDSLKYVITQGDNNQQLNAKRILDELEAGRIRGEDALQRIQTELQSGSARGQAVLDKINQDLTTGGAEQRQGLEKLWGLTNPEVTAQERYNAALARQSFEAQDRSLREARDQDLAARGLRGGSAAIGSALAGQEQLGLDRTNAELGLQATAQQRALQALQLYGNQANAYRAAQQQGIGMFADETNALNAYGLQGVGLYGGLSQDLSNYLMGGTTALADQASNSYQLALQGMGLRNQAEANYNQSLMQGYGMIGDAYSTLRAQNQTALANYAQQTNQIRAAQQQGLAMANDAANKLRAAQQNGLALQASEANALRAAHQQGLAMYWDATAQLRAQGDQVGMFNTAQANDISKFNAGNETQVNMFNAGQANSVNMFNAGQQNQAAANNQQTRLSGSIAAGNMANQIRSDNDAINMFNKEQSQITQRFQDQIALQDLQRREGLAVNTLQGNISGTGAQAGLAAQGYQAGLSNINDPYARTTQSTGIGMNAAGNILGIQSQTNAIQGAAGQQDLANLTGGYGTWLTGQQTLNSLSEADRQRQQTAQALGTLATRGGYRMS